MIKSIYILKNNSERRLAKMLVLWPSGSLIVGIADHLKSCSTICIPTARFEMKAYKTAHIKSQ
jgi:hypothetical protein